MSNDEQKPLAPHGINFDLDDRPTISPEEGGDAVPAGREIATVSDSVHVSLSRHGQILSAGRMLKSDRFPGCERDMPGQPTVEGVPNWREVDPSSSSSSASAASAAGVFGCAQPTRTGVRNAVAHLAAEGYERVVWVNMREEYVVYLGERSYCVKDRLDPFSNINLNGIKYQDLEESEEILCRELRKESVRFVGGDGKAGPRRVMLMDEAPTPANPNFGVPYHWWCYDDLESLSTIRRLYSSQNDGGAAIPVSYRRVPVTDEKAPEPKDVDHLIEFLREGDCCNPSSSSPPRENKKKVAFVFNCQMGRGRTTTAMVIASMVLTADAAAGTSETARDRGETIDDSDQLPSHPSLFLSKMCDILDDVDGVDSREVCDFVDAIIHKCRLMQDLRVEVGARYGAHAKQRQSLIGFLGEEDKYGMKHADASKMVSKKVDKHATAAEVYCNYLERYLLLLLIGAYVRTGTTDVLFTMWLDQMPSVSKRYWCLIETLHRNA